MPDAGAPASIQVTLQPQGVNGQSWATVAINYLEARVRYRLYPDGGM
jgi:hypothetical protein